MSLVTQPAYADNTGTVRKEAMSAWGFPLWILLLTFFSTSALLTMLWVPQYLAFQDHPSHLYRIQVLSQILAGREVEHFVANSFYISNQLTDLLTALICLALSVAPDSASRAVLSTYVIGLPVALGYYLQRFQSQVPEYLLMGSLLVCNQFVLMSNENFVFSLPIFLTLIALWKGGWDLQGRA